MHDISSYSVENCRDEWSKRFVFLELRKTVYTVYGQMYCTYRKTVRNLLAYSLLADNSSFKRALC